MKKATKILLIIGITLASLLVLIFMFFSIFYFVVSGNEEMLRELFNQGAFPAGSTIEQAKSACVSFGIIFLVIALLETVSVVLAAIPLKKLSTFKSKNDTLVWGILNIIFGFVGIGTAAGIILLVMSEEDLKQ